MPPGVYARKPRPAAPRFWSKVDKSGGPDACWPWLAGKNDEGYGTFYLDGRTHRAHRVAYRWANGPVPDGFVLDHLCRMPSCVNPAHLFEGTQAENLRDRDQKGRNVRGERVASAVLTPADVHEIRASRGESQSSLARRFGVVHSTIHKVLHDKTWKDINP